MGLTMTQKILAAHAGRNAVRPGDLIEADVDLVLGNDITAPPAIREFRRAGTRVFDPERIALVPDHFAPNKDIASAEQCRLMRDFAREQGIVHYFEVGRMGVEHALLPEQGLVGPGDLVVGADSHTCTYGALGAFAAGVGSTDMAAAMLIGRCWFKVPAAIRIDLTGALSGWASGKDVILDIIGRLGVDGARYQSLEFNGPGLRSLSLESRLTAANMAVEAGAKNGIFPVDEITVEYLRGRLRRPGRVYEADGDAEYERVLEFDLSSLRPLVACPHLPENVKPAAEIGTVPVDQVVIGSCTNGRIEDLRVAADVLRGRAIDPRVRLLVVPATPNIYLQALEEGLLTVFIRAGGAVSTPTCGPCLGGHMGVLAAGERAVATTNRNFVGRMGHPASEVYLAGPAVAAASAVAGRIVDPVEVCGADVPVEAGNPPAPAAGRAR